MGEIVLSAFADEFSKELDRQIEAMNRFSIGWIELRGVDGKNVSDLTAAEAAEVGRRMAAGGVRASSIGSPLGKIAVDGDMAGHLERARRCFETANLLGTPLCRVFSFYLPKGSDPAAHREAVLERVGALLDLADKHGVTLCHENEAGIYGESPERCLDLLTAFGGRLRCVFDMGNFVLGGYPPYPAAYAALKPYIRYFHIKDALASGAIVPAGCGEAHIGDIVRDFRDSAEGPFFVSLEPHLVTFDGLKALTDRRFENPYVYETKELAFADAVARLRGELA